MVELLGTQNIKLVELLGLKFTKNIFKFLQFLRQRDRFLNLDRYHTLYSTLNDNNF